MDRIQQTNPSRKRTLAEVLRALAEIAEQEPAEQHTTTEDRYYSAETSPLERRAWDRARRELEPLGKVFRPGKKPLIRRSDLHEWIERQPTQAPPLPKPGEVVSYDDFAAGIRQRRAAKRGAK